MKSWEWRKSPSVRVLNEKRAQNQALENPVYKSEQENLTKELVKNGMSDRKKYQEKVASLRTRKATISGKREWSTKSNTLGRSSKIKTKEHLWDVASGAPGDFNKKSARKGERRVKGSGKGVEIGGTAQKMGSEKVADEWG